MKIDTDPSKNAPSDADLLRAVALARDAESVRRAQAMFYERHIRFLYGAILRRRRDLLSLSGIGPEDLVQDTFARAFERAHSFEHDATLDNERAALRTRAWLGRIAEHLLADVIARRREVTKPRVLEQAVEPAPDSQPASERIPKLRHLTEGLAELSERERDVLRVSALYFRTDGAQRLPNEVSAELAARWETNNDNIRAIRTRAMKKLKAFVENREREQPS